MKTAIVDLARRNGIPDLARLVRWILTPMVALIFAPLLLMTVVFFADASVSDRPGAMAGFAAFFIPLWVTWFAIVAWIIRTAVKSHTTRLPLKDPNEPHVSDDQ